MPRTNARRAGRKQSSERIRELISLLASLSRQGAQVSVETIAQRLGISVSEASDMMSIVCQASGEGGSGLLISANDEFTEFTLQYPAMRGRAIRLTYPETMAVVHALDLAEVADDDPLRTRLRSAFSSLDVADEEVRQVLGPVEQPHLHETLRLCALARAQSRMLDFSYMGLADAEPAQRCVLVRRLRIDNNLWYVDAYDLDRLEDRTFRVDRMRDAHLGPRGRLPVDDGNASGTPRQVAVVFNDLAYLTLFEWPGLRITKRNTDCVEGTLPYYGSRSDWLLRRIAACGGTLIVKDERITSDAREYARITLA